MSQEGDRNALSDRTLAFLCVSKIHEKLISCRLSTFLTGIFQLMKFSTF